jgi:hypothetical protein
MKRIFLKDPKTSGVYEKAMKSCKKTDKRGRVTIRAGLLDIRCYNIMSYLTGGLATIGIKIA